MNEVVRFDFADCVESSAFVRAKTRQAFGVLSEVLALRGSLVEVDNLIEFDNGKVFYHRLMNRIIFPSQDIPKLEIIEKTVKDYISYYSKGKYRMVTQNARQEYDPATATGIIEVRYNDEGKFAEFSAFDLLGNSIFPDRVGSVVAETAEAFRSIEVFQNRNTSITVVR